MSHNIWGDSDCTCNRQSSFETKRDKRPDIRERAHFPKIDLGMEEIWFKCCLGLLIFILGKWHWHWAWIVVVLVFYQWLRHFFGFPKKPEVKQTHNRFLPGWVVHPDSERLEWVNVIVGQVWPYLDRLIVAQVEKALVKFKDKYHIRSTRITLGEVPPRLTGIKFHPSTHRDEVIVDSLSFCF